MGLRVALLIAILTGCISAADAQQSRNLSRVAIVFVAPSDVVKARFEAFRQGMRDLGYVEGKNIVIEGRFADGRADRLPAMLTEIVRLKTDVIVSGGSAVTRAAKDATSTIPIVMAQEPDPVASGMVASLSRPGGNITGLSLITPQIVGKQLELLKEIGPTVSRVAVIWSTNQPMTAQALKEADRAAAALKLQIQKLDLRDPGDVDAVFRAAAEGRAQALLVLQSFVALSQRNQLAEFSIKSRLPSISPNIEYVEAGGLMAYGASIPDVYRRAGIYVDKILKGARPANLPVEQPTKLELVINLRTAKRMGVTIPREMLTRADRVIE